MFVFYGSLGIIFFNLFSFTEMLLYKVLIAFAFYDTSQIDEYFIAKFFNIFNFIITFFLVSTRPYSKDHETSTKFAIASEYKDIHQTLKIV